MNAIELPRLSHSGAAHLVSFSYAPLSKDWACLDKVDTNLGGFDVV